MPREDKSLFKRYLNPFEHGAKFKALNMNWKMHPE